MATCVFDNPATCRREGWADGILQSCISMELIAQPDSVKSLWSRGLREAAAAPFVPGRVEGDPTAIQLPKPS
jgi:hypothetical protein